MKTINKLNIEEKKQVLSSSFRNIKRISWSQHRRFC